MSPRNLFLGCIIGAALAVPSALAQDRITVGYFLEWPTPNQVAQINKTYDKALGANVEWRAFGNGNEMTQAMTSGDVQISYSQGFVPFVVGVTNGSPLTLVGIAVTYSDNDLCIIRDDSGITKANARNLEGMKVATPIGNVTHYKLLKTLAHLGVDQGKVSLVQMDPPDGAVALIRGDVVMACGFGEALTRMRTVGSPLMTGMEQEAVGIGSFDIITVTNDFLRSNRDQVCSFLKVTEESNADWRRNPDPLYGDIARAAGMDRQATVNYMKGFGFPSVADQKGSNWLGGAVQETAKGVADVMSETGNLGRQPLGDYSRFVDASLLDCAT